MNTKQLRQKILDLAIRGKLVPQDPNDEPASVLLERIKAEKEQLIKEGKIKRGKKSTSTSDKPHYPFDPPDGWVWSTLGEVGTWQSGGTPSRSNKTYYGGSIPWLKTGDLNDGLVTSIPESITQEGLENSSAKLNPKGSVLIAMYGATIGKIGILDFPATTNQACCACIDYPALKQRYLFLFLLSHKEEFISQGGGGAQPNISKEIIIKTPIPIPPINEQERIVIEVDKFLDIFKNLEECESGLIDSVSQIKKKILELAISGKLVPQDPADEPAVELLRRINPSAEPADKSHYKIPSSWVWVKLEDIFEINPKNNNNDDDECGFVPMANVHDGYSGEHTFEVRKWREVKKGYCHFQNGDIAVAKISPCFENLKSVIMRSLPNNIGAGTTELVILRCKKVFAPYFLYLFKSQWYINKGTVYFKGVVGQQRVSRDIFTKLAVPLPPFNEQKRIVAKIDELFAVIDQIQQSLE